MPIYEYKCSDCLHQFEKIQKFSEQSIKTCPVCNKDTVSKLISAPSFRLKGSGWYETDFKTSNKKNIVKNEKENEVLANKSDSKKNEQKKGSSNKNSKS